jgi:BON domain
MQSKRLLFLLQAFVLLFAVSCNKLGKPDDAAITTDIKAKMFSDPSLKAANVEVSTHGGEVTLSGQVPDDSARLAAYKIASESKGVSKVNDQMSVPSAQSATAQPATNPVPEPAAVTGPPEKVPPKRKPSSPKPSKSPSTATETVAPAPAASAANPPPEKPAAPTPPPPPQPRTVTVPAGSTITVRMIDGVDSKVNTTGQVFKASLDAPIVVDNRVIVPKGADVYVKLVNASSAGKIKGRSELTLDIQSIIFQGRTYNVSTSDVKQAGASRGKRSAATIGGGAVLGALIGGLAGGGKGAAIGAGVGAGAGTGVQVFTKGQQIKIPSETRLDFTLEQPFDITYIPQRRSRQTTPATSGNDQSAPDASSDRPPMN